MGDGRNRELRRRAPAALLMVAALALVVLGALFVAGCGDDESSDTTEAAATETTVEATDTTQDGSADAQDDETDAGTADGGDIQVETLTELPDDFPDLEMPDGTTFIGAQAGEVPDADGQMMTAYVAAFESTTGVVEQYEHFKQELQDKGYEITDDQMVADPVALYVLTGEDGERAVSVNGGIDPAELAVDFPEAANAENPFGVIVGPVGSF